VATADRLQASAIWGLTQDVTRGDRYAAAGEVASSHERVPGPIVVPEEASSRSPAVAASRGPEDQCFRPRTPISWARVGAAVLQERERAWM
jgi:hypothetical protein